MSYASRPVSVDEFPTAFALFKRCWQADITNHTGSWHEEEQYAFHHADFLQNGLEFILHNHEAVGLLGVDTLDETIYIRQFCVVPEWQDQGIGAQIITDLKRRATLLGRPLTLQTQKSNIRAQAFYARHSFEITGRTDTHVLMQYNP